MTRGFVQTSDLMILYLFPLRHRSSKRGVFGAQATDTVRPYGAKIGIRRGTCCRSEENLIGFHFVCMVCNNQLQIFIITSGRLIS